GGQWVVGERVVIGGHAAAAGIAAHVNVVADAGAARWSDRTIDVLAVPVADGAVPAFGVADPACGRAALASAACAIAAARAGAVAAVVAAPHNQSSIAAGGIPFGGHPGLVPPRAGPRQEGGFLELWVRR